MSDYQLLTDNAASRQRTEDEQDERHLQPTFKLRLESFKRRCKPITADGYLAGGRDGFISVCGTSRGRAEIKTPDLRVTWKTSACASIHSGYGLTHFTAKKLQQLS
jgi:hypothetical protein